jgi:hypothetical protein
MGHYFLFFICFEAKNVWVLAWRLSTWTALLSTVHSFNSLTHSWSWALLEKMPIVQLLNNFQAFYGTRRFITVFTRDFHSSLSWARSIQSISSHPIYLWSILILSTHLRLGLPNGLLPSGCPTNILYAFRFPICATCPAHLILLDSDT